MIAGRNEGARLAATDIIVSIDDDAEFSSSRVIEQTLRDFADPRIAAVAIPVTNATIAGERVLSANECYVTDAFVGTAYAVRRSVFLDSGGYREQLLHQGEENDFCIRLLNAGYVVRAGTSDPICHHESPKRDFQRMDFYGRRNDVLFAWYNVPWPYLPIHIVATTVNGIAFAFRTGSLTRIRNMLAGLARGYVDSVRYFRDRQPVRRRIYRINRKLKKTGPLLLAQIATDLPDPGEMRMTAMRSVGRSFLKSMLPDRPVSMPILRGPFRGARLFLNPRDSLRKIFGLYEHDLNPWIDDALRRVTKVIDVGANDGYFTFGSAAAFRRLKKTGMIFAFEPQKTAYAQLMLSEERRSSRKPGREIAINIQNRFVGSMDSEDTTTLDAVARVIEPRDALVKIDVEGAECEVINGASEWLNRSNLFLIEVHDRKDVSVIQNRFEAAGLHLERVDQRPIPWAGPEFRSKENCWLVSRIK